MHQDKYLFYSHIFVFRILQLSMSQQPQKDMNTSEVIDMTCKIGYAFKEHLFLLDTKIIIFEHRELN